jgi:CubicO group peptidase (beta-lactamase class C family)
MTHGAGFPIPQFQTTNRRELLTAVLPQIDALYARYAAEHHVPGMVYGVLLDGELVHTLSLGTRVAGSAAPVDADTVFRIASMSKSFAALAVIMLRDAGKLRLDDPAAGYAPELAQIPYPTRDSAPITVRQLLTMSAGWPEDDPWGDRQLAWSDAELAAHLARGVAFAQAPGVAFEYSNLGYMALGRVIHGASGVSAPEYIARHILHPLGMTSTVWNRDEVDESRLALGYRWANDAWQPEPILPTGGDVGAFAGLFTTLRDLTKWVNLFLSAFPPRDDADDGIVRRSSLREMQQGWQSIGVTAQQDALGSPLRLDSAAYGYGLRTRSDLNFASISHSGGLPGYGAAMRWLPDRNLGIIALGNRTYAPMTKATLEATTLLISGSQLPARRLAPSAALLAAQAGVNQLLAAWDDDLVDRLVAMNFFLDRSRESWRAQFTDLCARHGPLQPDGEFNPENALRGGWTMRGERGTVKVWLSLAPTLPPRVQDMAIEAVLTPSPTQVRAAAQLLRCVARPSRTRLAKLVATLADLASIWDQVRLANILCGAPALGEVVACDGETTATWRLNGSKQRVNLVLTLDAPTGKIAGALFQAVWQ